MKIVKCTGNSLPRGRERAGAYMEDMTETGVTDEAEG